ncbi:hypothetical protein [Pirellulimonas nuda]|nr:hypothetical protein [Pirellulimonas nuda]
MIHFTCDLCHRAIDCEDEVRYVVRLEVYASLDADADPGEERDHLQEIEDILEGVDDLSDPDVGADVYHQARYDLCSACRKRFVKNPLGRGVAANLDFSNN